MYNDVDNCVLPVQVSWTITLSFFLPYLYQFHFISLKKAYFDQLNGCYALTSWILIENLKKNTTWKKHLGFDYTIAFHRR